MNTQPEWVKKYQKQNPVKRQVTITGQMPINRPANLDAVGGMNMSSSRFTGMGKGNFDPAHPIGVGNFLVDEGEVITPARDVFAAGGAEKVNAAVEQAKLMNVKSNGVPNNQQGVMASAMVPSFQNGGTIGRTPIPAFDQLSYFNSDWYQKQNDPGKMTVNLLGGQVQNATQQKLLEGGATPNTVTTTGAASTAPFATAPVPAPVVPSLTTTEHYGSQWTAEDRARADATKAPTPIATPTDRYKVIAGGSTIDTTTGKIIQMGAQDLSTNLNLNKVTPTPSPTTLEHYAQQGQGALIYKPDGSVVDSTGRVVKAATTTTGAGTSMPVSTYDRDQRLALHQTQDIASGNSAVYAKIAKNVFGQLDARLQNQLTLAAMNIAVNPNMTAGGRQAAMAKAISDVGIAQADQAGKLALNALKMATEAISESFDMAGNLSRTEYTKLGDLAKQQLEAGDFTGYAATIKSTYGNTVDVSKLVDAAASKAFNDASVAVAGDLASEYGYDSTITQGHLKDMWVAQGGDPNNWSGFQNFAKTTWASLETRASPSYAVYGKIDDDYAAKIVNVDKIDNFSWTHPNTGEVYAGRDGFNRAMTYIDFTGGLKFDDNGKVTIDQSAMDFLFGKKGGDTTEDTSELDRLFIGTAIGDVIDVEGAGKTRGWVKVSEENPAGAEGTTITGYGTDGNISTVVPGTWVQTDNAGFLAYFADKKGAAAIKDPATYSRYEDYVDKQGEAGYRVLNEEDWVAEGSPADAVKPKADIIKAQNEIVLALNTTKVGDSYDMPLSAGRSIKYIKISDANPEGTNGTVINNVGEDGDLSVTAPGTWITTTNGGFADYLDTADLTNPYTIKDENVWANWLRYEKTEKPANTGTNYNEEDWVKNGMPKDKSVPAPVELLNTSQGDVAYTPKPLPEDHPYLNTSLPDDYVVGAGSYQTTIGEMRALARQGDVTAQINLRNMGQTW